MGATLRNTLLVCLLAAAAQCPAQTSSPYHSKLQSLTAKWPAATSYEKLSLLDQMYRLRHLLGDHRAVKQAIEQLASQTDNVDVKTEGAAFLADLRDEAGEANVLGPQHWYQTGRKQDVLIELRRQAKSGGADDLDLLARLETIAEVPEALEHMQQAAQALPSGERWAEIAALNERPMQKFAALQAGLVITPHDAQLNLQLATYYIGRHQLEKARDLLTTIVTSSPQDFVLREQLASVYLNLGLRSKAIAELHTLQKVEPAPLWLSSHLAADFERAGLQEDAARLAASVLKEIPKDAALIELQARFHERRHMTREALDDYASLTRLKPEVREVWSKLASLQMAAGDLLGARSTLLHLTESANSTSADHQRLATVYERLHLTDAAKQESASAASSLSPARDQVSADREFLADTKSIVSAAFRHPPTESDVALADVRIQELLPNGLERVHEQQIYYVGTDAAAEAHRTTSIRFSTAAQQLRILHARVWKPNGDLLEAEEIGDHDFADPSVSMYYDLRTRELRAAALAMGDILELEWTLTPTQAAGPYGKYFGELVSFASHSAVRSKKYVLIAPGGTRLFVHAEKTPAARSMERNEKQVLVWEAQNLTPFVQEPNAPGLTELAPYVHISTIGDWKQLGAWYADLVRPQFRLNHALEEELKRTIAGRRTEREKIAAVHEFVLLNTHYIAQEFGVYSYKPWPVADTYVRRFGDCKDKASLMIAMLRGAGVEAQIALVRTRSLGEVASSPDSMSIFNHAIAYVPKYDLWLDGTAEWSMHELPLEDQGALALTVDLNGATQVRRIPLSRAADNYTRHTIHAELSRSGNIRFSGSTVTRGEDAPGLRREFSVRDHQVDLFRRDMAEIFPAVQVDSVDVHGEDNLASAVSVDFRGALDTFDHKRSLSLTSSWMPRGYLAAFAAPGSRGQDLVLPGRWTTEEEVQIALPEVAQITFLPHDQNISTRFGSAKLHYEKTSRGISVGSVVQFDRDRISAADYPAFRQFCAEVERAFREEINLELPE